MHPALRHRAGLLLGALAAAGVVAAHGLAYFVLMPNGPQRPHLLPSIGHDQTLLVAGALGALVAGVARFIVGSLSGGRAAPVMGRGLFGSAVIRLAAFQVLGFALLEGVELFRAGAALTQMLTEPAVALGLVFQVVAAALGAALLALLAAAIERFVRSRRPTLLHRSIAIKPLFSTWVPAVQVASGGATLRGPPASLDLRVT